MALLASIGNTGGSRLSPPIWDRFAPLMASIAPCSGISQELGFLFYDDFKSFDGTVAANVGKYVSEGGGYRSYEDTGGAITQLATYPGGVLNITTDTTDNDECWIQGGGATGVLGGISDTAAAANNVLTAFECRFRTSQVASGNFYIGMAEETCAIADFITDAGAMITTKDLLGFYVLEGALTTLKFTAQTASQTAVTITMSSALAADTWYKAGFLYNPKAPATKRLSVFLDAVENSSGLTSTQMAAATFPTDQEMHVIAGVKNSTTTAKALLVDWMAFGQMLAT